MGRKLFWDALLEIPVGVSNSWNETIFKLVCVLIYICLEPVLCSFKIKQHCVILSFISVYEHADVFKSQNIQYLFLLLTLKGFVLRAFWYLIIYF